MSAHCPSEPGGSEGLEAEPGNSTEDGVSFRRVQLFLIKLFISKVVIGEK
jgi:hypothetical protein